MQRSILSDIKKLVAPDTGDEFNDELVMHINDAIETLVQNGACPKGSHIDGNSETWSDIFADRGIVSKAKAFIYFEVRLSFDPPPSSYAIESLRKKSAEALWRINHDADYED